GATSLLSAAGRRLTTCVVDAGRVQLNGTPDHPRRNAADSASSVPGSRCGQGESTLRGWGHQALVWWPTALVLMALTVRNAVWDVRAAGGVPARPSRFAAGPGSRQGDRGNPRLSPGRKSDSQRGLSVEGCTVPAWELGSRSPPVPTSGD